MGTDTRSRSYRQIFRPRLHDRRHADRYGVVGDVAQDNRIGSDQHVVADPDRAKQLRTRTDVDVVADRRRAFILNAPQSDDDAVTNAAIVTKFRIATDNNATKMINHEVPTNFDLAGQLDPGDDLDELVQHVVER